MHNLIGQTFGKLTVVKLAEQRHDKRLMWECICSCDGRTKLVKGTFLVSKKTRSCGCLKFDKATKGRTQSEAAVFAYFRIYKQNAYRRDYVFKLTIDEFRALISKSCNYCGTQTNIVIVTCGKYNNANHNRVKLRANGIDRIDNNIGYIIENCVPCCTMCNQMKMNMTAQQYIDHCRNVVKHNENAI